MPAGSPGPGHNAGGLFYANGRITGAANPLANRRFAASGFDFDRACVANRPAGCSLNAIGGCITVSADGHTVAHITAVLA